MVFGIALKKLLLINFWFSTQIGSMSRGFLIAFVVMLLVVFAIGLAFKVCSHTSSFSLNRRRVFAKWYRLLATCVVLGELLMLFRQYNVYVLGARFWWLILLIIAIAWGYRIVQYSKRQEQTIEQARSKETYSKYLPKKQS